MNTFEKTRRGGLALQCTGLASGAIPEVKSATADKKTQKGVSTHNAPAKNYPPRLDSKNKAAPRWYALRATYGREMKACDYLRSKGMDAFCPTVTTMKLVGGKRKRVNSSRLPNTLFVYGTEEEIKQYVYDNVNLPYLRFYYRYSISNRKKDKTPLTISASQMQSMKIICEAEATDIIISSARIEKFETGDIVSITDGAFKGVVGRVARYHGQQRVAVMVDGLVTAVTAYIPSAFLKKQS